MKKVGGLSILVAAMLLAMEVIAQTHQGGTLPTIGFLVDGTPPELAPRMEAFRQGLREFGYIEGKNFVIEQRSLDGKSDKANLAAELVGLKVAVIVTMGTTLTQAAKNATGTIPIVMTYVSDPIGFGFVASLARPGGNITGMTNFGPELRMTPRNSLEGTNEE